MTDICCELCFYIGNTGLNSRKETLLKQWYYPSTHHRCLNIFICSSAITDLIDILQKFYWNNKSKNILNSDEKLLMLWFSIQFVVWKYNSVQKLITWLSLMLSFLLLLFALDTMRAAMLKMLNRNAISWNVFM